MSANKSSTNVACNSKDFNCRMKEPLCKIPTEIIELSNSCISIFDADFYESLQNIVEKQPNTTELQDSSDDENEGNGAKKNLNITCSSSAFLFSFTDIQPHISKIKKKLSPASIEREVEKVLGTLQTIQSLPEQYQSSILSILSILFEVATTSICSNNPSITSPCRIVWKALLQCICSISPSLESLITSLGIKIFLLDSFELQYSFLQCIFETGTILLKDNSLPFSLKECRLLLNSLSLLLETSPISLSLSSPSIPPLLAALLSFSLSLMHYAALSHLKELNVAPSLLKNEKKQPKSQKGRMSDLFSFLEESSQATDQIQLLLISFPSCKKFFSKIYRLLNNISSWQLTLPPFSSSLSSLFFSPHASSSPSPFSSPLLLELSGNPSHLNILNLLTDIHSLQLLLKRTELFTCSLKDLFIWDGEKVASRYKERAYCLEATQNDYENSIHFSPEEEPTIQKVLTSNRQVNLKDGKTKQNNGNLNNRRYISTSLMERIEDIKQELLKKKQESDASLQKKRAKKLQQIVKDPYLQDFVDVEFEDPGKHFFSWGDSASSSDGEERDSSYTCFDSPEPRTRSNFSSPSVRSGEKRKRDSRPSTPVVENNVRGVRNAPNFIGERPQKRLFTITEGEEEGEENEEEEGDEEENNASVEMEMEDEAAEEEKKKVKRNAAKREWEMDDENEEELENRSPGDNKENVEVKVICPMEEDYSDGSYYSDYSDGGDYSEEDFSSDDGGYGGEGTERGSRYERVYYRKKKRYEATRKGINRSDDEAPLDDWRDKAIFERWGREDKDGIKTLKSVQEQIDEAIDRWRRDGKFSHQYEDDEFEQVTRSRRRNNAERRKRRAEEEARRELFFDRLDQLDYERDMAIEMGYDDLPPDCYFDEPKQCKSSWDNDKVFTLEIMRNVEDAIACAERSGNINSSYPYNEMKVTTPLKGPIVNYVDLAEEESMEDSIDEVSDSYEEDTQGITKMNTNTWTQQEGKEDLTPSVSNEIDHNRFSLTNLFDRCDSVSRLKRVEGEKKILNSALMDRTRSNLLSPIKKDTSCDKRKSMKPYYSEPKLSYGTAGSLSVRSKGWEGEDKEKKGTIKEREAKRSKKKDNISGVNLSKLFDESEMPETKEESYASPAPKGNNSSSNSPSFLKSNFKQYLASIVTKNYYSPSFK